MEDNEQQLINYANHLIREVRPFVQVVDEKEANSLSLAIDSLIMPSDDAALNFFQENKERKEHYALTIKKIKEAIKDGKIDENAPWFKKLSDSLLRHEIYSSGMSTEKS